MTPFEGLSPPSEECGKPVPIVSLFVGEPEVEVETLDSIGREYFEGSGFSLREELSRPWGRVWAARMAFGSPPVGFLAAWHIADELHVLNVATAVCMRRQGVGRALIREALRYAGAHRVRILLLEVRRSNQAAIQLYRGCCFTVLRLRRAYYADNDEDAVEMILALDPETGCILPARDEIRIDD